MSRCYLYASAHSDVFDRGVHIPALLKVKMIQIEERLQELWGGRTRRERPQNVRPSDFIRTEFKALCGFDHKRVREWKAEMDRNDGHLFDADATGRKKRRLEDEADKAGFDLKQYARMCVKDRNAKSGLTLRLMKERLLAEKGLRVKLSTLSATLHRLQFSYGSRAPQAVAYRARPEVQSQLRSHCAWVASVVVYNSATGLWSFKPNVNVGFMDASWVTQKMIDLRGWKDKLSKACNMRNSSVRVCLLDTIFPHVPGETSCRVHWNCQWKRRTKNPRKFYGNNTAETTQAFFTDHVFPVFQAEYFTVLLDNASVHRAYKQSLKGYSAEDLIAWIEEHCEGDDIQKFHNEYAATPGEPDAKWIRNFIKRHELRTVVLQELAQFYGGCVRFLPPYFPECNAIELVWRLVKNEYKKTNPAWKWEDRLKAAYEKVTPAYIASITSTCIKWCLSMHMQFRQGGIVASAQAAAAVPEAAAPGAAVFSDDDNDDDEDESDDSDDEE